MSVNIKDGRRTCVAEPEWFPRPDGLERAVVFQPGYNSDPDPDPSRDYGVHSMEICWYLRGRNGAAAFSIYTDWIPGELSPGHGLSPAGYLPRQASQFPSGIGLGYHALIPQYEGQENYGTSDCTLLPGGNCYSDNSGMAADRLAKEFVTHGEPAIWAALQAQYADLKVSAS